MHLYLVRHAKAGSRHDWHGPDQLRPLSKKGRHQADELVKLLVDGDIGRVLSSSFVRCVETVQPLADKLGIPIGPEEALAEGATPKQVMALVRSLAVDAVLCSHGDVIPKVLDALASDDGVKLPTDYPCPKGSTWALTGHNGKYMEARYIPPPA